MIKFQYISADGDVETTLTVNEDTSWYELNEYYLRFLRSASYVLNTDEVLHDLYAQAKEVTDAESSVTYKYERYPSHCCGNDCVAECSSL